jgi:hypothetical protein
MILIRAIYPSSGWLASVCYATRRSDPTRALTVAHHGDGLFVPIEVGPNVGASLAASLADEPQFQVGQPDVIGPLVPAKSRLSGYSESPRNKPEGRERLTIAFRQG